MVSIPTFAAEAAPTDFFRLRNYQMFEFPYLVPVHKHRYFSRKDAKHAKTDYLYAIKTISLYFAYSASLREIIVYGWTLTNRSGQTRHELLARLDPNQEVLEAPLEEISDLAIQHALL